MDRIKMEKGIDVSKWQGKIDWKKVFDAGVRHVCVKMTEGRSFVDCRFVENWKGAQNAGINTNCYHYFRALGCTPAEQFENIQKTVKMVDFSPLKNILAVDVEMDGNENATPQQMADNLYDLLRMIQRGLSCTPMIYASFGIWDTKVAWEKYDFSVYPLWVAHWDVQTPKLPANWRLADKSWRWWQHSSRGKIDGIPENLVDLDWVKCA